MEEVEEFNYLGKVLSKHGEVKGEVSERVAKGVLKRHLQEL